ncbi:hypothetical protein MKK70_26005 [Methylobacterium sp. E-041]|jgi:hypothetical protein|uniref:hypothetical protein n=1 Tax=unclassified Methylobacterium TaxID=2615210 RepID=UPI0011CA0508|nr:MULTISPECIES: hypothetical protein [unclassified Methylobacterium]RZK88792.1 MAG: hypothetical protein EOO66_17360 [Methylobacterium sp.]MCJ2010180.1 hypothetical protein [Methylobacterium sp. J-092]MCJ2038935.1 hypothetical protein [Methylobacterium sp. J-059]MCJ2078621.1 hypothetical protein [Methylobacterium sp. E-016]MCJ2108765.1 hypothetical protein [Methylobacterium sp. E-041]
MNKLILGATVALGLLLGANTAGMASPGDGLDRNAAATGNGRMGGMHAGARTGGMMRPRMGGMRMMRRHHRRHHR